MNVVRDRSCPLQRPWALWALVVNGSLDRRPSYVSSVLGLGCHRLEDGEGRVVPLPTSLAEKRERDLSTSELLV